MTVESESNRPNEFGFAGDGTAPEPDRTEKPVEEVDGEKIAVPADDLTGAISSGIEEATGSGDDNR
ncbi:hypothetical protein [Actinoplanes friuliensis]|jgi:hypothetical protein|uniref:Uncharacterized protein n=1 Tax=Actinoplanes friuliensis DSM 7358 TaxID=1246995 RepID=U5WAM5_9ACTN|nr:hypothetical protein [Actinoplanes friuliensis]AGZ46184.1 hypothetical protein AFR_39650 [Actinoplanes friuliensis DSM 7358]